MPASSCVPAAVPFDTHKSPLALRPLNSFTVDDRDIRIESGRVRGAARAGDELRDAGNPSPKNRKGPLAPTPVEQHLIVEHGHPGETSPIFPFSAVFLTADGSGYARAIGRDGG
jgi:hypothetical protein